VKVKRFVSPVRSSRRFTAFMKQYGRRLYDAYIAPRQRAPDAQNRELVLNVLLVSSLLLLSVLSFLLIISYAALQHAYVLNRIAVCLGALLVIAVFYSLSRRNHYRLAAYGLVLLYYLMATVLIVSWGIILPLGELLCGLVIVLSGILLRARQGLWAAGIVCLTVIGVQLSQQMGWHEPNSTWLATAPNYGDAISFCVMFAVLGLVSWLFNRRMEYSLLRANMAEQALLSHKQTLEERVQERTQELERSQFEKIEQLQRFAALGQLSAAVVHDLTNHLSILTLDIESLHSKQHSDDLRRAQQSIRYIDKMVERLRAQLHGTSTVRRFGVVKAVREVEALLLPKTKREHVVINITVAGGSNNLLLRGDAIRFQQLIAIVLNNAIDAYAGQTAHRAGRTVDISIRRVGNDAEIVVSDWGAGLKGSTKDKLFESFYTTKATGTGIGLFIGKQIAEEAGGTIEAIAYGQPTSFRLRMPRNWQ
jgi:signal transduction histidine kinase